MVPNIRRFDESTLHTYGLATMNTQQKLQSLLSAEEGFSQFFELLVHTSSEVQDHFFQQITLHDEMPHFVEESPLWYNRENLSFEESYALGMNLLAASGQLRGRRVSLCSKMLHYQDWSTSGITGLFLVDFPESVDSLQRL